MSTSLTNAVVFSCDENYLPAALFVAGQLSQEAHGRFDIIVLHVGPISPALQAKAPGVRFMAADLGPVLSSRNSDRYTPAAFARLLVPQLVPKNYRRVLYLDCDVWIGDRPVAPLFDIDLDGHALAAVSDIREVLGRPREHFTEYKRRLALAADTPYFNSGVLLIDCERYIAQRMGERALDYLLSAGSMQPTDDQSVLNAVFAGRFRELSLIWNWPFATRSALTQEFAPAIIHFIGTSKPWNDVRARYPQFYWAEMAAFHAKQGVPDFTRPAGRLARLRRTLGMSVTHVMRANYDRRERAIRAFMREARFCDVPLPADVPSSINHRPWRKSSYAQSSTSAVEHAHLT